MGRAPEDYPLENYPDYEPGKPPRTEVLEEFGYLDELAKIWGKRWGSQGIGRLREVALVRPTEHEKNPLWAKDPKFFLLRHTENIDMGVVCKDHDAYAQRLRDCGVKELHVAHATTLLDTFESGGEFHIDMVFGVIDLRKAIVFPAQLDYETYKWLRSKRFELIEIPADEQRKYYPANLVMVEPGKVIMPKGAVETIRRVERAGVEVIAIETEGIQQGGVNGISCITGQLLRDPGPGLED